MSQIDKCHRQTHFTDTHMSHIDKCHIHYIIHQCFEPSGDYTPHSSQCIVQDINKMLQFQEFKFVGGVEQRFKCMVVSIVQIFFRDTFYSFVSEVLGIKKIVEFVQLVDYWWF